MKKLNIIILIIGSLFIVNNALAQKAKISTNEQEIITIINAISTTDLFTNSGNIKLDKIISVVFEKREDQFESLYSKISEKVKVEFAEGESLGEVSDEEFIANTKENQLNFTDENTFTKIDSINLSQDELYARAKAYLAYSFKSAQDVIQLDDPKNGKIIAKGNFSSYAKVPLGKYTSRILFTFTIDVRDGKFRGIIDGLYHDGVTRDSGHIGGSFENENPAIGTFFFPKSHWIIVKKEARIDAIELLEDFSVYMKSKPEVDDF